MNRPASIADLGLVCDRPWTRITDPLISLIVPVFNEEQTLGLFMAEINRALPAATNRLQIIFINDGSRDGTLIELGRLAQTDARVLVVNLSRNFGKEAALSAGLSFARGDVAVPIDVDLQDPPDVIPRMLEKWAEGFDVVVAHRASRTTDGPMKRFTAGGFYRIFNLLSSVPLPSDSGDFRLMDRVVVEALSELHERNRFMKGLFAWAGFRTATVEYNRAARSAGETSWNYMKLWNFAIDGIVGFSTAPLKVWTYVGLAVATVALLYSAFIVIETLFEGVKVPGYASLMAVDLIMGAVTLISLGVLGEYVGRAFLESKQRPLYLIDGVYRKAEPPVAELTHADESVPAQNSLTP